MRQEEGGKGWRRQEDVRVKGMKDLDELRVALEELLPDVRARLEHRDPIQTEAHTGLHATP